MRPVLIDAPEAREIIAAELRQLGMKFDADGMTVALFVVSKLVEQGRLRVPTIKESEKFIKV